ncbi:MAG: recombinase family protein [Eubacteriales bacterium]
MNMKSREVIVIPATKGNHIDSTIKRQLRVASYSRVSTGNEEQLSSFQNQQAYYSDLILKNPNWTPAGNFADEGISGATAEKRPDFMRMIRHCKKGKIDLIITKSVSRFARNTVDSVKFVRQLKAIGVGVLFEKEGMNTLEETSELFLTIMSSLAQEEMVSLSSNVKMGKRMLMKEGKVTYQFSKMYGYKKDEDNMPEVIPEEASLIQRMYQRYLLGDSVGKIVILLNDEGNFSRSSKKWTDSKIRAILEHERYCGDVILQKTFVADPISKETKVNNGELPKYHIKNNHEGIVTRETWNAVQAEILRRSNKKKTNDQTVSGRGKYNGKLALSEILICSCCGSPYMRKQWKKRDGTKQYVWRCVRQVKDKCCSDSVNIDEVALHEGIVEALFTEQPQSNVIQFPLLQKIQEAFENTIDVDFNIAEAEGKVERLKQRAVQMVTECAANNSLHLNQEQIKALSDEARALQNKIDEAKQRKLEGQGREEVQEKMKVIHQHLSSYTEGYPKEYDDGLVRQAVHTIKIVDSDCILIYFNNGTTVTQKILAKIKKIAERQVG